MRGRAVFVWFAVALFIVASAAPSLGHRRGLRSKPAAPTTLKKSKAKAKAPRATRAPTGSSRKLRMVIPVRRRDLKGEQQRLQQTQKELRQERARAEQARRREGSVLAELEQVGRQLADKRKEVARLDGRIRRVQAEVTVLQRDIARLERRRADQEALLARRLRAIYKVHTQGGAVPVVLSGADPVDRAMAVRHLTSLAALDARLIQEYRETSSELAERKGRDEERQRELTELRGEARREQVEVDREAARRRGLLAKVRDERAYHERMVGELSESSRRLEAFIRELEVKQRQARERQAREREAREREARAREARERQPARISPPPSAPPAPPAVAAAGFRGRLQWPAAGRVAATFGEQVHPRFGTRTHRNGLDIEAAEGTAVEAVLPGQVVYTGWFKGYGNLIIIDHGGELFTLYAHVSEIHVKEGDDVRQGQRIGAVGDTGSLLGPRLYFEVRYRGKPQDPGQWLRPRG